MENVRLELIFAQGVSKWVKHSAFKNAFTLHSLPHTIIDPSTQLDSLRKEHSLPTPELFYCNFAFPILTDMSNEDTSNQVDYYSELTTSFLI
jgi:hypothetical protein